MASNLYGYCYIPLCSQRGQIGPVGKNIFLQLFSWRGIKDTMDTHQLKRCWRFGSGSTIILSFPVVIYSSALSQVKTVSNCCLQPGQNRKQLLSYISTPHFNSYAFVFNPLHLSPLHISQNLLALFPSSMGFLVPNKRLYLHSGNRRQRSHSPTCLMRIIAIKMLSDLKTSYCKLCYKESSNWSGEIANLPYNYFNFPQRVAALGSLSASATILWNISAHMPLSLNQLKLRNGNILKLVFTKI